MPKHNCFLQGKAGEYIWLCSRCQLCYVCYHRAVFFFDADQWMWKTKKGKFEEVILDGRLHE